MRRLIFVAVACVFLTAPLYADTVDLTRKYGYFSGQGGEFIAKPGGWSFDPLEFYADSSKNVAGTSGTFQTFCIEAGEDVSVPGTYEVMLSDRAVLGGAGASGGGDPISRGTAYLYYQFAGGTLSGYDYTPGTNRIDSADALQSTIWWLEEEIANPENVFSTLVLGEFGGAEVAKADNAGLYPVRAMNMYVLGHPGEPGYESQDMLTMIPLPGAVLLGVLGLSAAGVKLRRFV